MNRTKAVIALTLSLVLSGCGGAVGASSLSIYIELCKPHGGLMAVWIFSGVSVDCANGVGFDEDDVEAIMKARENAATK